MTIWQQLFEREGLFFPTIRGILSMDMDRMAVTVDMGAVSFIHNGADVMSAGIVEADPGIREGDIVWVRDVKNRKPLAVGTAPCGGPEMVASSKGKAVRSIHYVGDELWNLEI